MERLISNKNPTQFKTLIMKTIVTPNTRVEDVRAALTLNANTYTTDELWQALRHERKNKNRITIVRMLRRAIRRQLRYTVVLMGMALLAIGCAGPSKLTQSELEVLTAYDRAKYKEITVHHRIYYLDSVTVWMPCGEGWYCRSREVEHYMNHLKHLNK